MNLRRLYPLVIASMLISAVFVLLMYYALQPIPETRDGYYFSCVVAGGYRVQWDPRECIDYNGNKVPTGG